MPNVGMVAIVGHPPKTIHEVLGDCYTEQINGVHLFTWGLADPLPNADTPLLLTTTNRQDGARVDPRHIARWLNDGELTALRSMLPPFAALGVTDGGLRLATDGFGFRPIYRAHGDGWSAVSTSARRIAGLLGSGLDMASVLLQSQLGWQLGSRTLFEDVSVLAPGEAVLLRRDRMEAELVTEPPPRAGTVEQDVAVRRAADRLREFLENYLDDTADPTIQLTGGQDSRIVLGAIPVSRRRGLRAMTLHTPGSNDARIAARLAERYGLRHVVRSVEGLDSLGPEEWYRRVLGAAHHYESMTDPISRAIIGWAEESFDQGERLCGLGGEVARGFYYMGHVRPKPVTRGRAETLARWRMLANESVSLTVLHARHREGVLETAIDMVHEALVDAREDWYAATDHLYLHRMRRWAGLSETAVTFRRSLTNPMLDHPFVDIALRLAPEDKARSLFLARLQVALDDDLARLPLDNRPSPRVYATPGPTSHVRTLGTQLTKLGAKVSQRVRSAHRPPPGGRIVAERMAEHLRANPELLDPARESGVFDERWLDDVVSGDASPSTTSLSLLTNVLAANGRG